MILSISSTSKASLRLTIQYLTNNLGPPLQNLTIWQKTSHHTAVLRLQRKGSVSRLSSPSPAGVRPRQVLHSQAVRGGASTRCPGRHHRDSGAVRPRPLHLPLPAATPIRQDRL
jgi:hypothetical protein